jgi:hypothetical protein
MTQILGNASDNILIGNLTVATNSILRDQQRDAFVAINKDQVGYTLTIADYEIRIDRLDLRAFGVRSANDFLEIQDKGSYFELKTTLVNFAELVLRINANPFNVTYIEATVTLLPQPLVIAKSER